jgi:acyl-[acyl-carrier-protein] desaturase
MSRLSELGPLPNIDLSVDERLLPEITGEVVKLINRHTNPKLRDPENETIPTVDYYIEKANLWTPAMMLPWSLGENYPKDEIWTPEDSPMPEVVRTAFIIGLLTEDNLPWYTQTIEEKFGKDDALKFWNRIWVAEEGRHSEVMRNYMSLAHIVDPVQLERDRMAQVVGAKTPHPPTVAEAMVYVTLQELATRISHQNTSHLIGETEASDNDLFPLNQHRNALANMDPEIVRGMQPEERDAYARQVGRAIMNRVAGDENKHFAFYGDSTSAAKEVDPSTIVLAIERQVRGFQMPGEGIRNFLEQAFELSEAGVYDLPIHINQIVKPVVLGRWGLKGMVGLSDAAEKSRERTIKFIDIVSSKAKRFEEQRASRRDKHPEAIWVGKHRQAA